MSIVMQGAACAQAFRSTAAPIVERIKELAHDHARNPQAPKPIIAIAGCPAVGKSYFTRQLYQGLKREGVKVAIVLQDDFMHPKNSSRAPYGFMHENFDYNGLHRFLQSILAGQEHVQKSAWDKNPPVSFTTDAVACFWNIDVILLEGTYILCDSDPYNFLQYSILRIFIDAAENDIRGWKKEREIGKQEPARSAEEFEKRLNWNMDNYRTFIKPTQKNADFVVHKESDHSYTIIPVA